MLEPGRVFFTQYNSNGLYHYIITMATWPVHYAFLSLQPFYDLWRSLNIPTALFQDKELKHILSTLVMTCSPVEDIKDTAVKRPGKVAKRYAEQT